MFVSSRDVFSSFGGSEMCLFSSTSRPYLLSVVSGRICLRSARDWPGMILGCGVFHLEMILGCLFDDVGVRDEKKTPQK